MFDPAFPVARDGERTRRARRVRGVAPLLLTLLAPVALSPTVMAPAAMAQGAAQGAAQERYIRAGVLRCDVSAGIGLIVGSTRTLSCVFEPTRGRAERYQGRVQHAGLDIGATTRGVMVWGVLASARLSPGALAGTYAGAAAEATVGLGLGANALFGGSERGVALQPVSVQAQAGLNIALGVASLTLEPVRATR
jgi:hypothetical protein